MAVYKRSYKGYSGAITPTWSRFMILPRYSYARLFQSKFLIMFLVACFFYPLGCAAMIYLAHNLSFLKTLNIPAGNIIEINAKFFYVFATVQAVMCYILTALVGPTLVSPDLVNNALPLYFGRPFSRAEYVIGKMSVLMCLLSLITWVPGLILFSIQASLAGWEWTRSHLWLAGAIVIGPLVWNAILSLIAIAMSAWVKWKIAAGALILGVFFAGAGFGAAINGVMRTNYGTVIDLAQDNFVIWAKLFRLTDANSRIDIWDAANALAVACIVCLWLLFKKVRAFEVVK
jgi:ABC-2 type transport system permease protein